MRKGSMMVRKFIGAIMDRSRVTKAPTRADQAE